MTNPARFYPELLTWKAADFSFTGVENPGLHLCLLLLRARDIEPNTGTIRNHPAAMRQYTVTSHHSSAHPASGTSAEPVGASPSPEKCICPSLLVQGGLLHYHLRRPSPIPTCHHADVTHRFDLTSVPSRVNSVRTSHTESALATPVMRPTPPGRPNPINPSSVRTECTPETCHALH